MSNLLANKLSAFYNLTLDNTQLSISSRDTHHHRAIFFITLHNYSLPALSSPDTLAHNINQINLRTKKASISYNRNTTTGGRILIACTYGSGGAPLSTLVPLTTLQPVWLTRPGSGAALVGPLRAMRAGRHNFAWNCEPETRCISGHAMSSSIITIMQRVI